MAVSSQTTLQIDGDAQSAGTAAAPTGRSGGTVQPWDAITGKPFTTIGDGLAVSSGALEAAPGDFAGEGLLVESGDLKVDVDGLGLVAELDDLSDVTLNDEAKYEPQDVLAGNGNGQYVDKTISTVLGETVLGDVGNVAASAASAESGLALMLGDPDGDSTLEWVARSVTEQIRKDGDLSIGDVSIAGSSRVIKQDGKPTQRPNGDPLEDGDIWIDTDASPIPEAQVYRDGAFRETTTAIAGNQIVTGAVNADKIQADTITADEIEANTITAKEIKAGAITADEIDAGTITSDEIQAGAITTDTLDANSITTDKLQASSITTDKLEANSITTDKLQADSITANEADITSITTEAVNVVNDANSGTQILPSGIDTPKLTAEIFQGVDATITSELRVGANDPRVLLDGANGRIESSNFASGQEGFRIDKNGFAEFANARVRGELRSTVVAKEEVAVVGGTEVVTPGIRVEGQTRDGFDEGFFVESTSYEDGEFVINYKQKIQGFIAQSDRFDVGDSVRFKNAEGGGQEEIRTVDSKTVHPNGSIEYKLQSPLFENWEEGAIAHRWEERIVQQSNGEFAPFTSYVDEKNREVGRVGSLAGLSGGSGYGISFGLDQELFYDTGLEQMNVEGRIRSDSGEIGGFDISETGLQSDFMVISNRKDKVLFVSSQADASVQNQIQNPSFSGNAGWQVDTAFIEVNGSTVETQTASFKNGLVVDKAFVGDEEDDQVRSANVVQSGIDATGLAGQEGQIVIEFKYDPGFFDFGDPSLAASFAGSGGTIISSPEDSGPTGQINTRSVPITIPPSPGSNVDLSITWANLEVHSVTVDLFRPKLQIGRNEVTFFDNSGSQRLKIDSQNQSILFGEDGVRIERSGDQLLAYNDNGQAEVISYDGPN